jgi:tripartite-type tricarboxylate transporter receptor subunit TctC
LRWNSRRSADDPAAFSRWLAQLLLFISQAWQGAVSLEPVRAAIDPANWRFSRMNSIKCAFAVALAAGGLAAFGEPATAETSYPTRAVQMIVPFPPGGNTDLLTRIMADQYSTAFKQPFTVVSRPGAGANIGAAALVSAEPDGYTLLMAPPGPHVINEYLYKTLPFDPERSFAPITMVARFPNVLVVHESLGVKSIEELIAKAKANPGKIDYATSGVGSTSHLSMSLFLALADIQMNHIPYKGTSQSLQDLITGRVALTIDNLGPILPFIRSGRLIALGVSTATPVSLLPGIRPIGTVVKGYEASSWNALSARAGTPREVIDKLSVEANVILRKPEVIERIRSFGSEPVGGTPEDTVKFFNEDRVRWKKAVDVSNLQKL